MYLAGSSQGEVCCQQWTHWEEQMPKNLNQIQREVSDDIQSSRIEAADVQHASVIRARNCKIVGGHPTNNQLGRNTHFLQEGEQKNIRKHTQSKTCTHMQ